MAENYINDKVAVVTGGAKGIGLAISEEFLKEGAKAVVIIDVNSTQGANTAETLNSKYGEGKAFFKQADVTKDLDEVFDEIVSKYKTVDILVNNAGVFDENDPQRTLNINLIATMQWSMKFLEHMRKDKGGAGGTILNVASLAGVVVDSYMMFYRASKFGVRGFTQSFGHVDNFTVTGVRALVLCPGYTKTDLIDNIRPHEAFDFQVDQVSKIPDSYWQDVSAVSRAAVQILRSAESGTAWHVNLGEQAKLVPSVSWSDL